MGDAARTRSLLLPVFAASIAGFVGALIVNHAAARVLALRASRAMHLEVLVALLRAPLGFYTGGGGADTVAHVKTVLTRDLGTLDSEMPGAVDSAWRRRAGMMPPHSTPPSLSCISPLQTPSTFWSRRSAPSYSTRRSSPASSLLSPSWRGSPASSPTCSMGSSSSTRVGRGGATVGRFRSALAVTLRHGGRFTRADAENATAEPIVRLVGEIVTGGQVARAFGRVDAMLEHGGALIERHGAARMAASAIARWQVRDSEPEQLGTA